MNVALFVGALTISFTVRNTSVIGWPLLLAIKVLKDGAFLPFLLAGILVFFPLLGLSTVLDSLYYGWENFPVVTALNFLRINVSDGLANYFGTEPWHYYLTFVIPQYFIVAAPFVCFAFVLYTRDMLITRREVPHISILIATYVTVFSLIKHKEVRFLLPIIPVCSLLVGYFSHSIIKRPSKTIRNLVWFLFVVFIAVETAMCFIYTNYRLTLWQAMDYVAAQPHAPHSIYTLRVDGPYYTYSHRQNYIGFDG
jgi:phosphatidylinositol glycan class B